MSEPFIGQLILFAGNFAPQGWAFCNGQLLSIAQNTALFSILGTTYGGDGVSNFALPDLRGRAPVGFGQGPGLSNYNLGQQTGSENVTLTQAQMPAHGHNLGAQASPGNALSPAGAFLAQGDAGRSGTVNDYTTSTTSPTTLNQASVQPAGGSQPHPNIQPVLAMNYIIALQGVFPSRG